MKRFFMVNKDVKFADDNQEWLDVSLEDLRAAAEIDDDVATVRVFESYEDAKAAALDGVDLETETDYFPIFAIDVADNVKGRKAKYALEDGTELDAIRIRVNQIEEVTDALLEHIGFEDVHFGGHDPDDELDVSSENQSDEEVDEEIERVLSSEKEEVKEEFDAEEKEEGELALSSEEDEEEEEELEAAVEVKQADIPPATKLSRLAAMSQYAPSPKALLKNGLMVGATGAAYYFGNEAVVDLAAKASVAVPEMLANSSALPLVVGTTARLATEVPELAIKSVKLVVNTKAAAKVAEKAAPAIERVSPYVPSTKNLVKNGLAAAAGALALYFGNAEVVSVVAQAGFALPEALAASALLPAGVAASARLVTEVPEVSVRAASFLVNGAAKLIEAGKAKWNARRTPAPSNAQASQVIDELKARLAEDAKKEASAGDLNAKSGSAITFARNTQVEQSRQRVEQLPVEHKKEQGKKMSIH